MERRGVQFVRGLVWAMAGSEPDDEERNGAGASGRRVGNFAFSCCPRSVVDGLEVRGAHTDALAAYGEGYARKWSVKGHWGAN